MAALLRELGSTFLIFTTVVVSIVHGAAIQHLVPSSPSTSPPPSGASRPNCSAVYPAPGTLPDQKAVSSVRVHLLSHKLQLGHMQPGLKRKADGGRIYIPATPSSLPPNCSEPEQSGPEIEVSRPGLEHYWKNHIIIGCTVAAAVEVVIVVLIVLYWKQIRWTLRKIVCPCTSRERRNSQRHEAMEREDQDRTEEDLYTLQSHDPNTTDQEMQTFSAPRQRHHLHDSDDEVDSHDRSEFGVMDQRSGVTEYDELVSRDSSMDATSIDTARKHYLAKAHKMDCISNPSAINYFPYPSESGSCNTEDYVVAGGSMKGSEEDGRSRISAVEVHYPPPPQSMSSSTSTGGEAQPSCTPVEVHTPPGAMSSSRSTGEEVQTSSTPLKIHSPTQSMTSMTTIENEEQPPSNLVKESLSHCTDAEAEHVNKENSRDGQVIPTETESSNLLDKKGLDQNPPPICKEQVSDCEALKESAIDSESPSHIADLPPDRSETCQKATSSNTDTPRSCSDSTAKVNSVAAQSDSHCSPHPTAADEDDTDIVLGPDIGLLGYSKGVDGSHSDCEEGKGLTSEEGR